MEGAEEPGAESTNPDCWVVADRWEVWSETCTTLPREGQEHLGRHDLGDARGYSGRGEGVNSQLRLRSLRCLVCDMADVAHLLASRVVQVDNPDGCLAGNLDRLGHEGRERDWFFHAGSLHAR